MANNYYDKDTIIFHNGKFVKAADATMDLYSQSLHYGYAVFEGIRSYKTDAGEAKIFKAVEHFDRLANSAKLVSMPYPWTTAELIEATYEVLAKNNLQDAYIRPLVYAPVNMSFNLNSEANITIQAWPMQPFLGEKLIRVFTSSYQRPNPKAFHIEAKASGHYVNSLLASYEAKGKGFDEALLLDGEGFVAEAPGANIFYEKGGKLFTPALGNILPGITRATVLEICVEENIPVEEKQILPQELAEADAAFFCGTAAEVIGIESIDNIKFPLAWANTVSEIIRQRYADKVREKSTVLQ